MLLISKHAVGRELLQENESAAKPFFGNYACFEAALISRD
jgi:hypothetical protein